MKIAFISDTHTKHREFNLSNFDGVDVVVHSGDFSHNQKQKVCTKKIKF